MDSEKKWGCIGYALLALIIWGLTQGFKVVCIIIGILIAILIAFIFISNLSTKRLIKKFKHQKDIYPNAYSFFRKELRIFQSENNLTKQDINKFLSFPKVEWEKREKLELERIQREKQVSTEYNMIKANYSDGLTCWQKEHPSANKSIIISNITEIIDFDRRQKEFLSTEEWEKAQIAFSKLCRSKKSTTPHSGCYFYNMNFQKTDYKGNIIQGEYRIWQFFFSSFCTATDLDYTHFKQTQENNINIDKYKEGKINTPSYINIEISNFIKSLGVPVQVIAYGAEFDENLQVQFLTLDLAVLGFQSCALHHIDELSSNYVVIIDGVTTQDLFVKRCESVIQKFKHQKPCIVYISLMKEFSREEMQKLIDKKNIEVQQQKQIKDEINSISNALKSADIETAKEKVKKVKDFALSKSVDKELIDVICKTEKKIESDYAVGVVDDFDVQYVDYLMPSVVQDKSNWKYPVTKYPEDGCIVFPYRRKAIARRGFSEAKFQNYLQDTFRGCDLLILGDCNILPVEDNRPFEPDIAIICKKHPSIRIDIEIDEPYAAFTRKPIHYIGCGDDFRDALLNNIGWIVIRFTEYQVFFNPKGCAAFIAQVLHYIQPSMVLPIDFLSCSTPKEIERWTEIEAKVMASENTREKYLNHEFGIVDNEKLEIADITQTEKERVCAKRMKPLVFSSNRKVNYKIGEPVFCEKDVHIQFYPQEHIYLYDGQEQFIPVSSVISCFFKPFDSYYWSEYKANQRNISQGQILEEWDSKGACSRDVGTFMHQQIENYYKGLPYQQEFSFKYDGKYVHIEEQISLELEYMQFIEFLENHKFKPFRTEWAIYDDELKIAGTIDMIHKRGDVFDIYDWKRSHRIVDFWGKPIAVNNYGEKGLGELNQIEDTPYWHYCIQQNLYRYILERNYDIIIEKMYLVVFCDDTNEYRKLEVPRMDEVIISIVKSCKNETVKKRLITLQGENLS